MLWRDPMFWVEPLWAEMQSVQAFNLHGKPVQTQLGWMGSTLSREIAGFQNLPFVGHGRNPHLFQGRAMNIVEALRAIVGTNGVLDQKEVATRSAGALRQDNLKALALVRPVSTQEVSEVLRRCNANGVAVVTQGGLTGLVHGSDANDAEVILSMERMRTIENIDCRQRTAIVQAGVVLQILQEAVDAHALIFPLDLGARGSATLGGNAATNAGGNRVIRYGMMRDMVLGLEVVLADGTVISSMNSLIKNNTGYDLKQLFLGSEGTLGVITRLVLRLREKPQCSNVAIVAATSFDALAKLLKHMDRSLGGMLSAFEVMWQSFYQLVTTAPAVGKPPLSQDYPFYVLIESQGADRESDTQRFNAALAAAMEQGLLVDAAISQSDSDCHAFWALRDDVAQVVRGGAPVVFDVSLPIAEMEQFANSCAMPCRRRLVNTSCGSSGTWATATCMWWCRYCRRRIWRTGPGLKPWCTPG